LETPGPSVEYIGGRNDLLRAILWLDTFSFQARPFYEKLGYEVFGQLEDYPRGHSRYFLQKRF
jgi:hypothetical protein